MFDRLAAGEMPPKKAKKRPAPADIATFTHTVSSSLTTFEKEVTARDGRAIQRRLNRYEYENALRDLLNVPWAQVKDKLPHDGEVSRLQRRRGARRILRDGRLTAADYAMRQAMSAAFERPDTAVRKIYARDAIGSAIYRARMALPDRSCFRARPHAQPEVRGRAEHEPGRVNARPWARYPASSAMPVSMAGASTAGRRRPHRRRATRSG
jgi:hypothetical protein